MTARGQAATGGRKRTSNRAAAKADQAGDHEDFLPKARELSQRAYADGQQVLEDASALLRTVRTLGEEAESALRENLEARPYAILGGAATAGFVLGRGLTLNMGRIVLTVGGRWALNALMRRAQKAVLASM